MVAGGCASAYAQGQGVPAGQTVESVIIRFLGATNVSEQIVRANMQMRENEVLDDVLIDRDIRSLYRTGLFVVY